MFMRLQCTLNSNILKVFEKGSDNRKEYNTWVRTLFSRLQGTYNREGTYIRNQRVLASFESFNLYLLRPRKTRECQKSLGASVILQHK